MSTRRLFRAWAVALLLILAPVIATAQGNSPGGTRTVALTSRTPLSFGSIVQTGSGGAVVVRPDGSRSVQGVFATADGFGPARFDIRMEGAKRYTILLPGSATLVSDGGDQMIVDSFVSEPSVTGSVKPPAGTAELVCGATLHVQPSQRPGTYRGTYLVIVSIFE